MRNGFVWHTQLAKPSGPPLPIKKFHPKNLLYLPKKNTQPKKRTPYNYRKRSNFSNKNVLIIAWKSTLFQMCFEYNSTIFMLANINQSFLWEALPDLGRCLQGLGLWDQLIKGAQCIKKKKNDAHYVAISFSSPRKFKINRVS